MQAQIPALCFTTQHITQNKRNDCFHHWVHKGKNKFFFSLKLLSFSLRCVLPHRTFGKKKKKKRVEQKSKSRVSVAAGTEKREEHWVTFSKWCEHFQVENVFSSLNWGCSERSLEVAIPGTNRLANLQICWGRLPWEKMIQFFHRTRSPVQPRTCTKENVVSVWELTWLVNKESWPWKLSTSSPWF